MELRHLNYFLAVAEELNFTRAAARLHIAQPPLSVQIRQLEEEIGAPLLSRTSRRVVLTEAGEAFLEDARRIVGMAERAVARAHEIGTGRRGSLRLGSVYSAIYAVVPQLLGLFGKFYPDVAVELSELTVEQQIEALNQCAIDVGILRSPVMDVRIETRLLFREGIVALVPRNHPLASRGTIALSELSGLPFILSGIGLHSSFRQHVLGLCDSLGVFLDITREVAEIHSIISLVGAGLGVALAPSSVRRIKVDHVTYLDISDPSPPIEVSLAWLKDAKPPALSSLLDLIARPEVQDIFTSLEAECGARSPQRKETA